MKEELEQNLFNKYPDQYRNLKHIEFEDGWFDIVYSCCAIINNHIDYINRKSEKKIDFWWTQQKSKFGGIRLYNCGADEYISGVVSMAESISYSICQFCGNKGIRCRRGGWVEVLCDKCMVENNYTNC
jgi:hypothetical protein